MMMSLLHAFAQGARVMGLAILSLWLCNLFGSQDPVLGYLCPASRKGRRMENDVCFYASSLEAEYFTSAYYPVV